MLREVVVEDTQAAVSEARMDIGENIKKMEKTGNNVLHVFNPIPTPNLAFLWQLTLDALFANKVGESPGGTGQQCFALLTVLKD